MHLVRGSQSPLVPASHEDPQDPGVLKRVLLSASSLTAGQVQMVNWSVLRAGRQFAAHYHQDMQEVFVMLAGVADMQVWSTKSRLEADRMPTVDPQKFSLQAGDALLVEPGEIHQMINRGTEDVTYLVFGISNQENGKTVVVGPAHPTNA